MEAVLAKPPLTKAAMTLFSFDNTTDLDSIERDFGFQPLSLHSFLANQSVEERQDWTSA
jgi:NADH dehydrogenase